MSDNNCSDGNLILSHQYLLILSSGERMGCAANLCIYGNRKRLK